MQYFSGCATVDDIKRRYRDLAKQYHPDRNPATRDECNDIMIAINAEYERLIKLTYRNEAGDKYSAAAEAAHLDIAAVLDDLVNMSGVDIEVCGTWIWIGGLTLPHKDRLAALGFRWSRGKSKWYRAVEGFTSGKRRGFYNMDQIRKKHGTVSVKTSGGGALN